MENLTRKDTWLQFVYMTMFAGIFGLTAILILAIMIIQFTSKLVLGKECERLAQIGGEIGDYFRAIILFLTYRTKMMPYPFGEWPTEEDSESL